MTSRGYDSLHVHIDHATPLVMAGFVSSFRDRPGFTVSDATSLSPDTHVDVLVADLARVLDWTSRRHATSGRAIHPTARAIVLSASDREIHVRQALEAGAYGYLLLESTIETLTQCILSVARGQRFLCDSASQRIVDSLTHKQPTERELEILQLIARGDCNKRIAQKLNITLGTVKSHIRSIHQKLMATSRTQAVNVARTRGLLEGVANDARRYAA